MFILHGQSRYPGPSEMAHSATLVFCVLLGCLGVPRNANASWKPVALTDSLGAEIDSVERRAYGLFPDADGFESARTFTNGSRYRVEITERKGGDLTERHTKVSAEQWDASRLHASLVESYRGRPTPSEWNDDELEYWLALRFAAQSRHDVSRVLLEDLASRPVGGLEEDVVASRAAVDRILTVKRGLFLPGPGNDRSGRTDLLIFSGLYGLWTGVAVPIAMESEDPQVYAAGLLAAPTAALLIASGASRNREMGVGRAHVISTGGWLGTWQGIGWSSLSEAEGSKVVAIGLVSGYAGIAASSLLTSKVHFTEGQGVVMGHALPWGAWFGFVGGAVAGIEGDGLLRATLVGSDALVLGSAIGAQNVRMSKGRVRLISLMGIVGTAAGFGVDLLAEVDDAKTALAMAGMGSAVGLAAGVEVTRNHDKGKDLSEAPRNVEERWSLAPHAGTIQDPESGRPVPAMRVRVTF